MQTYEKLNKQYMQDIQSLKSQSLMKNKAQQLKDQDSTLAVDSLLEELQTHSGNLKSNQYLHQLIAFIKENRHSLNLVMLFFVEWCRLWKNSPSW